MELWIVILIIAFIFLAKYTRQPLLNFTSIILMISQIFIVENTMIMLALIFSTLFLLFATFYTKV